LLTEQVKLIWDKEKKFELPTDSFFGIWLWDKNRGKGLEEVEAMFIYY
jgi:hypothetical protein